MTTNFLDTDPDAVAPEGAPIVHVIPAAYGTPPFAGEAILAASPQVELFDEELWCTPKKTFAPEVLADPTLAAHGGSTVAERVAVSLGGGAFPVVIVPDLRDLPEIAAACRVGDVLHIDSQPRVSPHAPIGRTLTAGHRCETVGVRALTPAEAGIVDQGHPDYRLGFARPGKPREMVPDLPAGNDYLLAIDASVFDPSLVPTVELPMPGGLMWEDVLTLLRAIVGRGVPRAVILSGHRPQAENHAADFLLARLLYKLLAYVFVGTESHRSTTAS